MFKEDDLRKKMRNLSSSQLSIQTLSVWLIHHREVCNSLRRLGRLHTGHPVALSALARFFSRARLSETCDDVQNPA
jgi:hypothetical protein